MSAHEYKLDIGATIVIEHLLPEFPMPSREAIAANIQAKFLTKGYNRELEDAGYSQQVKSSFWDNYWRQIREILMAKAICIEWNISKRQWEKVGRSGFLKSMQQRYRDSTTRAETFNTMREIGMSQFQFGSSELPAINILQLPAPKSKGK